MKNEREIIRELIRLQLDVKEMIRVYAGDEREMFLKTALTRLQAAESLVAKAELVSGMELRRECV